MNKIEKISHRYVITFQIAFFMTIVGMIYFWSTYMTSYDIFTQYGFGLSDGYANIIQVELSVKTRIIAFLVSMLPCSIILYGISQLIILFKEYKKGVIFTVKNVKIYKKLAYSLYFWVVAGILYDILISLALSFNNPPGHRFITISFQGLDIVAILIGTIVLMISYVMNEALILSENDKFTI
tara:strand:- start:43 stop:588 length:546 start_codon:yes stop_codon:yes gene_type:complete